MKPVMIHVSEHTVRVLDQEIDTIEICPTAPDYVILGTYSLIKTENVAAEITPDDDEDVAEHSSKSSSSRIGSLQVLPISHSSHTVLENAAPEIARQDLPCAVLDIRFCPTDGTLLGAATSTGELRFFRIAGLPTTTASASCETQIIPLGFAQVFTEFDHEGDDTPPPLVTQFAWIEDTLGSETSPKSGGYVTRRLAVCDTTGYSKLVQVSIPDIGSTDDHRCVVTNNQMLPCRIHIVHQHLYSLEAWTVNVITLNSSLGTISQVLLSGGDDGCLIGSVYSLDVSTKHQYQEADPASDGLNFEAIPTRFYLDKNTHTAGVVSILPLIPPSHTNSDETMTTPILTGSYDQHLRLHLLNNATLKFTYISSIELEGGVWRISLIDSYVTTPSKSEPATTNYILLVSAMHAGCYVVRLTSIASANNDGESGNWDWKTEARFTDPHESMVYACTAKRLSGEGEMSKWKIISTSFYDKRICVWEWTDEGSVMTG